MIRLDFKDPFESPQTEEEGFLASQVPKPDFGRGPAIDLDRGAPKATPKFSIDFKDPFAPEKTEVEVDWSPIRSPEELRKGFETGQPIPPTAIAESAIPGRRVQIPQGTTQPQITTEEESWPEILGKSAMGGLGAIGTGMMGAGKAALEVGGLKDTSAIDDLAKLVTDYWTPKVGQDIAKKYASGIVQSTFTSLPMMLTGPAALPLFGITSGGQKYLQMREAGQDIKTSLAVAVPVGASEALTEMLPLGVIRKAGTPIVQRLLKSAALELPGEEINTIVESIADKLTIRPDMTWKELVNDLVDTAIITLGQTFLTAGLFHAVAGKEAIPQEPTKLGPPHIAPKEHLRMPWPEEALALQEEEQQKAIKEEEPVEEKAKPEEGVEPIPKELTKPEELPPVVTKAPEPEPKGPPPQALDIEQEVKGATDEDLIRIREELLGKKEGEEPTQKIPGIPPQGEKTPPPPRSVPPSLQTLIDTQDVDSIIRRGGGMEWGINGFYLANELAEENVSIDDPDLLNKTGFTPIVKEAVSTKEEVIPKVEEEVLPEQKEAAPQPAAAVKEEEITPIPEERFEGIGEEPKPLTFEEALAESNRRTEELGRIAKKYAPKMGAVQAAPTEEKLAAKKEIHLSIEEFNKNPMNFIPEDLEIDRTGIREKTGKEFTFKQNAKEAVLEIDGKIDLLQKVLGCIGS